MASFFTRLILGSLNYHYFFHHIALTNLINYIHAFIDFSKHGMVAVEVFGVFTVVADKKLRATCVSTRMSHGKHSAIVVLIAAR